MAYALGFTEPDLAFWRFGYGREKRQKFLIEIAQRRIVYEKRLVNLSEALEDGGIRHKLLAHLDEGANDEEAHLRGA